MPKKIDLTGQKFSRLFVLAEAISDKNQRIHWECKCDCGKMVIVRADHLKDGHVQSCGCLLKECSKQNGKKTKINLTGQKFGRLTVLRDTGNRKDSKVIWECECSCGKKVYVTSVALRSGNTRSCGCLRGLPEGEAAKNSLLLIYKGSARKRGIAWELSDEDFFELIQNNCYYDGVPPLQVYASHKGDYKYNGIDRVDNTKGYTKDNCVACCWNCNNAKKDMTQEKFYDFIARISNHQRLKFLRC